MKILPQTQKNYFGLKFLATGKETNGRYFLSETTIPPGDPGPPPHTHSYEDEGFYVLRGEITIIVNGESHQIKSGQFINIEKGDLHTWRNTSDSVAVVLVTFAPAGIENMFIELETDSANIIETGKKYGTDFHI